MPWWAWSSLLVPAAVAAAIILPRAEPLPSLAAGAFLAGLDLAVENAGAALGWWTTTGGLSRLGVTPVEVLVVALLAGACLGPVLERVRWELAVVAGLAGGAVVAEQILISLGMMGYGGPWNAGFAFVAYLGALGATRLVDRAVRDRAASEGQAILG